MRRTMRKWHGTPEALTMRVTWIYILCAVFLFGHCQSTNQIHDFTMEMTDHVCTGSDVIETIQTGSVYLCIAHCSVNPLCYGSFYHGGDSTCVISNDWFTDTASLTSSSGMKYYQRKAWTEWMNWSGCTQTCGGGTKTRTRTCPTPNCAGGSTQETAGCHEFSCSPIESTCAGWAARGLMESCTAEIDPDGTGIQFPTVSVDCDFDSEPGKAITVMHHNKEARTSVIGYEDCGEYAAILTYVIGFEAVEAIAELSADCKQYIKYECYHAEILKCTFWRNRNQVQSTYITGPHASGKKCACGQTGTCGDPYYECNCDMNDYEWRYDDGYITDKAELPMYSFNVGDTGGWDNFTEEGYHTIGPLWCWGGQL